jgi:hypothetical protein
MNKIKTLGIIAIAFGIATASKVFLGKKETDIQFTPDIEEDQE